MSDAPRMKIETWCTHISTYCLKNLCTTPCVHTCIQEKRISTRVRIVRSWGWDGQDLSIFVSLSQSWKAWSAVIRLWVLLMCERSHGQTCTSSQCLHKFCSRAEKLDRLYMQRVTRALDRIHNKQYNWTWRTHPLLQCIRCACTTYNFEYNVQFAWLYIAFRFLLLVCISIENAWHACAHSFILCAQTCCIAWQLFVRHVL